MYKWLQQYQTCHMLILQYEVDTPIVEEYLGRLKMLPDFQARSQEGRQLLPSSLGMLALGTQPPHHEDAQAFTERSTGRGVQDPS